jgi:N-hydroxyarylamine O-acetyltransferase
MNKENIQQYLQRIQYAGTTIPSIEMLYSLQLAHLLQVPFENLDIHNQTKIELSKSFDKIVLRNRGGFCYELNGLFYELLQALGFDVIMISARAYNSDNDSFGPEFDHMAIIATVGNENYLVDVGFGEFALYPIKIELNEEHVDPRGIFIIEKFDDTYLVVKKKSGEGQFTPEYLFTTTTRELPEFFEMCTFHQTNPTSHFTQKSICSLPTKEGRITLKGKTLKITSNDVITERTLISEEEISQVLLKYFNVKL